MYHVIKLQWCGASLENIMLANSSDPQQSLKWAVKLSQHWEDVSVYKILYSFYVYQRYPMNKMIQNSSQNPLGLQFDIFKYSWLLHKSFVNILRESLLCFDKQAKYIHVKINQLNWSIRNHNCFRRHRWGVSGSKLWQLFHNGLQRIRRQYSIVQILANGTCKLSITEATDLPLVSAFIQAFLLKMIFP